MNGATAVPWLNTIIPPKINGGKYSSDELVDAINMYYYTRSSD